ncbi:EamA family transporter, partial [Acetobacter estunensis]|uniref:EamA family transporter n=1 Tax=Acetobacter estunensis TaxID=104097 RepID=UPI0034A02E84
MIMMPYRLGVFFGCGLGDAARVAPVDKLSVVFVAIFGVLVLGEHMSAKGWGGVVLIA